MNHHLGVSILGVALLWPGAAAAQRPKIMVFPSDAYMTQQGLVQTVRTSDGRVNRIMDYERSFQVDQSLSQVIASIAGIFQDRGYPLVDLEQSLRALRDQAAQRAVQDVETQENPLDQIMNTARPDIRVEVTYNTAVQFGERRTTFTLRATDAYSLKEVATTTGTGEPSASVPLPVLLREAVLQRLPEFEERLQRHFADVGANGREVLIQVQVAADAPGITDGLETELPFKAHNNERVTLSSIIQEVVADSAVRGAVEVGTATATMFNETVRIPVLGANGRPLTMRQWFDNAVVRRLRAEGIDVRVVSQQLGRIVFAVRGVRAAP